MTERKHRYWITVEVWSHDEERYVDGLVSTANTLKSARNKQKHGMKIIDTKTGEEIN